MNTQQTKEYRDWLKEIKISGQNIEHAPQDLMTAEMCIEATRQDMNLLKFVPEDLQEIVIFATGIIDNNAGLTFVNLPTQSAVEDIRVLSDWNLLLSYIYEASASALESVQLRLIDSVASQILQAECISEA